MGAGQAMRRRIVIIAIFLLAGAVVNVAVAWGCAFWSPVQASPSSTLALELIEGGTIVDPLCSGFGLRIDFVFTEGIEYNVDLRVTSGWPLLAMNRPSWKRYGIGAPRYPLRRAYGGVGTLDVFERALVTAVIRARQQVTSTPRRVFATAPIWPGFAINTLFYATVLWLLIAGLFMFRHVNRIRRGLCPACAYPARPYPVGESLVCSECGEALPERARETA